MAGVRISMQGVVRHRISMILPALLAGRSRCSTRCSSTVDNTKVIIVLVAVERRSVSGLDQRSTTREEGAGTHSTSMQPAVI